MSLFINHMITASYFCIFGRRERANGMHLYLHSARCPVVLRSFLDCNPKYWCFIPMPWHDAVSEDLNDFRSRKTVSSASASSTTTTETTTSSNVEVANIIRMGTIDNQRVSQYLEHVPLPPAAYVRSYQQRKQQRLFFEQLLSTPVQQQFYSEVDLYQIKIIAVCE